MEKFYIQVLPHGSQIMWEQCPAKEMLFSSRESVVEFAYNLSRFLNYSEVRLSDNKELKQVTYIKAYQ